MAKMNLAAQLKQAVDNVYRFDTHPLKNADAEDKIKYLKALSLIVHADKVKHSEEVAYLGGLFRTLNPGAETLDALLAFAQKPDFADLPSIRGFLRRQDSIGIAFLLDLVMLASADSAVTDEEMAMIGACRDLVGWDHTIFNRWYTYCATVASRENYAVFETCFAAFPDKSADHILQFRGFSRSLSGTAEWNKEALRDNLPQDWAVPQLESILAQAPADSLAVQVKNALAETAFLSSHPLKNAALEDKLNYLKALCLVMGADESIVFEEKAYFGAVTRTLVPAELVPGLLDYAANPDLSEIANMMEVFSKSEDYKICLLLDAAMLVHADGHYHQDEQDLVIQLRELLGWDQNYFDGFRKLAEAMATVPEGPVLSRLCRQVSVNLSRHLLEYRGLALGEIPSPLTLGMQFEQIALYAGSVINGTQISKQPVTLQQFLPFLQYLQVLGQVKVEGDLLCLNTGAELISLAQHGIEFTNENFEINSKVKDEAVCYLSPLAALMYCSWLSTDDNNAYDIPHVKLENNYMSNINGNYRFLLKRGTSGYVYKYELNFKEEKLDQQKIVHTNLFIVKIENKSMASKVLHEHGGLFGVLVKRMSQLAGDPCEDSYKDLYE